MVAAWTIAYSGLSLIERNALRFPNNNDDHRNIDIEDTSVYIGNHDVPNP